MAQPIAVALQDASVLSSYKIREAVEDDVPTIVALVSDLSASTIKPELQSELLAKIGKGGKRIGAKELLRDGFGDQRLFQCLMVEHVSPVATSPVGYCLYYFTYSAWKGKILFMEDLYVDAAHRKKGLGTKLMKDLAKIAVAQDCCKIQWEVLDTNTSAAKFYDNLGASRHEEWVQYCMERDKLITKFDLADQQ